jgi:hypothetical protein
VQRLFMDPVTGQAAYFGLVQEAATPAVASVRVKVVDRQVAEAEWYIGRPGQLGMQGDVGADGANAGPCRGSHNGRSVNHEAVHTSYRPRATGRRRLRVRWASCGHYGRRPHGAKGAPICKEFELQVRNHTTMTISKPLSRVHSILSARPGGDDEADSTSSWSRCVLCVRARGRRASPHGGHSDHERLGQSTGACHRP